MKVDIVVVLFFICSPVVLNCPLLYLQRQFGGRHSASESLIDQGPYVNLADGMVSAIGNEPDTDNISGETEACSASVVENNKEDLINNDFNLLDASKSRRASDQLTQQNKKAL